MPPLAKVNLPPCCCCTQAACIHMQSSPCCWLASLASLAGPAESTITTTTGGSQPTQQKWQVGRATWYDTIHHGSCLFWRLDQAVGTGWDICALPDVLPDYQGSCG
jgi:hypothetical protein